MKMITQNTTIKSLPAYVDYLQSHGKHVFLREQALQVLGISQQALTDSVKRLADKGRILRIRRGFFVIVPLAYKSVGTPPASWFIHDLMEFHQQPYYVGILSAAAIHGAAHQQPGEFQVVTTRPLKTVSMARTRIKFFVKQNFPASCIAKVKTATGYMNVSTVETTAIDVVRYFKGAGYLNNVATVLSELGEKIDQDKLLAEAQSGYELSVIQRLGYLLDYCGHNNLTRPLLDWVNSQKTRRIPLRPDRPLAPACKDDKWNLYINDKVELD